MDKNLTLRRCSVDAVNTGRKGGLYFIDYDGCHLIILSSKLNIQLSKIQIWRSLLFLWRHVTAVLLRRLRCQMQHARIDKCRKQNSDWVDLFRGNSMDLEFNSQGCDLYKSWRGLKMLHFGTSVVYWASTIGQIFVHSTVHGEHNAYTWLGLQTVKV